MSNPDVWLRVARKANICVRRCRWRMAKKNNKTRIVCRVTRSPILLEMSLSRKKRPFSAIPLEQMIATRFPDLVSSLYIYITKKRFPRTTLTCYKDIVSLSNYHFNTWRWSSESLSNINIGQGYKCKENNKEEGFTKLITSKRYKWILGLTAAFVQQDPIQREVSRWFTYLTDRTFSCIDKKSACYCRINR